MFRNRLPLWQDLLVCVVFVAGGVVGLWLGFTDEDHTVGRGAFWLFGAPLTVYGLWFIFCALRDHRRKEPGRDWPFQDTWKDLVALAVCSAAVLVAASAVWSPDRTHTISEVDIASDPVFFRAGGGGDAELGLRLRHTETTERLLARTRFPSGFVRVAAPGAPDGDGVVFELSGLVDDRFCFEGEYDTLSSRDETAVRRLSRRTVLELQVRPVKVDADGDARLEAKPDRVRLPVRPARSTRAGFRRSIGC